MRGTTRARGGTFSLVKLRREPDTLKRQTAWKVISALSGLAAAFVTRKVLLAAWAAAGRGDENGVPVLDPADRRFSWKDALLWAATAGVGISIARLLSQRLAVAGWEAATGTVPPGVEQPVEV